MATFDEKPQIGQSGSTDMSSDDFEQRLDDIADQATQFIRVQATDHPYRTLAAAAAVGYVLGAGVPNWAIRLGVNAATRMAVAAAISQVAGSDD